MTYDKIIMDIDLDDYDRIVTNLTGAENYLDLVGRMVSHDYVPTLDCTPNDSSQTEKKRAALIASLAAKLQADFKRVGLTERTYVSGKGLV